MFFEDVKFQLPPQNWEYGSQCMGAVVVEYVGNELTESLW